MALTRRRVLVLAAVVAAGLAVASATGEGRLPRYAKLRQDTRALDEKNARIAADNRRLTAEIRALREDPRAVERAAREDLGMVARDEVVYTFEER